MAKEKRTISLLEQALSLGQNGGIYYAGARVAPEEKQAVLFVGLGGSGADALIRIKDQITTFLLMKVTHLLRTHRKILDFWKLIPIRKPKILHMVPHILTDVEQSSVIFLWMR